MEEKLSKYDESVSVSVQKEKADKAPFIKLLERKDQALATYATDLEESVQQLQKKNAELMLWINSLRLYQEIFEHDTAAFLGIDKNGKVLIFNKAASTLLSKSPLAFQKIETIDFSHFDSKIPTLVQEAIQKKQTLTYQSKNKNKATVTLIPLQAGAELKGVLLKISTKTP